MFRQGSLEFYSSIIQQTQFLYFPRSTLGFSPLVRVLVRGSVCLPFPYFRPCSRTMLLFHGDHQVIISVSVSGWTTQPEPNCFSTTNLLSLACLHCMSRADQTPPTHDPVSPLVWVVQRRARSRGRLVVVLFFLEDAFIQGSRDP